jgi:soluble lytic murein transglycosylase-like protein
LRPDKGALSNNSGTCMIRIAIRPLCIFACLSFAVSTAVAGNLSRRDIDEMIARHALLNGLPVDLVHRVVERESRYDASLVGRGGTMGLMQIKLATARALGYAGSAAGLLDAETNLTYAVRYLAGAFRAARGHGAQAIALYARGYRDVAPKSAKNHGAVYSTAGQPD